HRVTLRMRAFFRRVGGTSLAWAGGPRRLLLWLLGTIPETQTITVDSSTYYAAFDEDERGTLPVADRETIPRKTVFNQFSLSAGTYTLSPSVLEVLETQGISSQHNVKSGSIVSSLDKPVRLTLPKVEFVNLQRDNPSTKVENVESYSTSKSFTRFNLLKDSEVRIDSADRDALAVANTSTDSLEIDSEYTHSYSGGGILGPIVGTTLLVVICMLVALITGIAAATFLNEYARKGLFTKSIRLAMLNLAGVPSIVFGLFGLGLFVMLAPSLTSTPHYSSKLCLPIIPLASEPSLRSIEERQIHIEERKLSTAEVKSATASESKEHFYTGWTYLSFQGWGTCMLAGGFTLAIMVLPVIITASEESLRAVPIGFREASLALGASKWQSIRTAVLPYATPGILTASVLGITRVAGETAPIMFTAAAAERSDLPWQGLRGTGFSAFIDFLQQSVQALPYHIYTVAGRIPQSEYTQPMQYGSVLVFMLIVMSLAGLSIWLRIYFRNK
ncbi:MAG: ABC transporter permease subunit, partial [Verrucomicrobiota bacterium]